MTEILTALYLALCLLAILWMAREHAKLELSTRHLPWWKFWW